MAVTVRDLRRIEAWSDWQAAGGSRISVVDDAIAARASVTIQNEQLLVTLPLDSPAVSALGARKVIRIDQADSRTNLLVRSQEFDNASWLKANAGAGSAPVVTANSQIAPDGTLTADKIVFAAPASGDFSLVNQNNVPTVTGARYTGSLYVQAFAAGDIGKQLIIRHAAGSAYSVITLTANWQRFTSTEIAFSALTQYSFGLRPVAGGGSSGTVTANIWQAQLESGVVATANIPTAATAVTVDAVFDEYKIIERAVDDSQGMWSITAAPLRLTDLAGCGLISRNDSDGVVVYDFEVLGLTPTQIITNWVLPALAAAGYGWISVGNITPTAVMDMTFAWDTPLSVLIRTASAAQSEIDLRRVGTGSYVIDIVPKINSSAQQADIRVDKNLVNITRTETSVDQATRIFPKGSVQDEAAGTMARARWLVSAISGSLITLADPAGGAGPIQFSGQLAGPSVVSPLNLGGHWSFDDGTASDNSGNGNNGTLLGAPGTSAAKIGNGLAVTGTSNQSVTMPLPAVGSASFTFATWFKCTLLGPSPNSFLPVQKVNGTWNTTPSWGFGQGFSGTQYQWWFGDGTTNLNGSINADVGYRPQDLLNQMVLFAAVFDRVAGRIRFYVNGVLQSQTADISTVAGSPDNVGPLQIGLAVGWKLTGIIDDVFFFTRALSASEVAEMGSPPTALASAYLKKVDGTLTKVDSSGAPNLVRVASATGISVGDLVGFRADSSGSDLTYLDNPAAIKAYGIKSAIREVPDVPATDNLIKNPVMRVWPGALPTNWSAVNAPTTAKQVAAPFTALGGASIKVTATADGQGVVTDAVPIFPTATNPYVSGFAKVWVVSGNARVELLFTTASGTKVWPAAPAVASASVLGQWADLGESGYDANAAGATAVAVRVVQQGAAASVFYVDAAQATATGTQQPFFEGSGATRLWQEANDALTSGSTPVASYVVPLADLEAYDPATWSESALIIGANARIVDPRLSIDIVTRIVGIERDYINPENVSVTLSNRPEDLSDILATTSRPDRDIGASDDTLTNPQQPKISASFDVNGQLIINSFGDNDVVSQKIAWSTGSAPSAVTVRAASPILQQNISGLATGSIYPQGTTVFIAAFTYNARGFESAPLAVVSESRQGAIIDYTPFASTLAPIAILSALPGSGAFVGQIVFLTTDKKLYRWDGTSWTAAVAAVDITGQIGSAQIAANAVGSTQIAALAVTNAKIAANAVNTGQLAASAVTNNELAALAVTGAKIAANTITAANIAAHTITAAQITALTITSAEIATGAIIADKISAGAITAGKLSVGWGGGALNSDPDTSDITAWDYLTGNAASIVTLTDGKVGNTSLRSNGYSAYVSHLQTYDNTKSYRVRAWVRRDGTSNGGVYLGMGVYNSSGGFADVSGNYFYIAAAGAIPTANTWTEYQGVLPPGGFGTYTTPTVSMRIVVLLDYNGGGAATGYYEAQDVRIEEVLPGTLIQDGAIITNKLAANAVTAAKILAGTITATQIAAATITGANIAANTISASNLVANTITAGQIQAGAIGTTELAALAVTAAKIAAGTITATQIAAGTITGTQIAAATITASNIVAGTITADRIVAGSITTTQLAPITVAASLADSTTPTITTGGYNTLTWNTSTYDPTVRQSGATLVCDVSGGLVIIFATIRWPSSNLLGTRHLRLQKGGAQFLEELVATRSTYNAGEFWQSYTWYDWNPAAGDAYSIAAMQDSGSTIAVEGKRFTFIHLKI